MTNKELMELRDDMIYGHEVELSCEGRVIYMEQCEESIEIYEMLGDEGTLLMTIIGVDRADLVNKTLEAPIFDRDCIYNCYESIEIIAID